MSFAMRTVWDKMCEVIIIFRRRREYRSESNFQEESKESFESIPLYVAILGHVGFYMLLFLGYVNKMIFPPKLATERNRHGYPPLYNSFESLFLNYVFRRIRDGWERPICGVPGAEVVLKDRISPDNCWTFKFTGNVTKCLNLGSYNYLGFAEGSGSCAADSINAVKQFGCGTGSVRRALGTTTLHVELEALLAKFLGVEDAIVIAMGFATNTLNIPGIVTEGCLAISDEKNHASLILALKLTGAKSRIYRHNDMEHLERILLQETGRTDKKWRKIFIVTEGIFSMEGSIVKLPQIIALKKKYRAYLYLDEAHSIGALGSHGRGVTDYYCCDVKDVDMLMGTFTKSFGSAGGYIAGSKVLINHIRRNSAAEYYGTSMPPAAAQQIITAMKIIMGMDGTTDGIRRIRKLAENTKYFRNGLRKIGCTIYGHDDSPVVPMMSYTCSKVAAVIRAYLKYNIATVGVGFPATPLVQGRIRFCLSAAHSKEQLKFALRVTKIISNELGLQYSKLTLCHMQDPQHSSDED